MTFNGTDWDPKLSDGWYSFGPVHERRAACTSSVTAEASPPNRNHWHGCGGSHNNNFKSQPQFGGDKMRKRNRRGLAQIPPTHHQKPDAASAGKKKKHKTNTLG